MEATTHHIRIAKTARYFQLGTLGPQTKRLWIVLHGYGQLAGFFVKHFENQVDASTCIVAPEGLSRFYLDGKWDRIGATWMTKEDRLNEIDDYIAYLDTLLATLTAGLPQDIEVILLGFSQGTATAWRWAMLGQVRPSQLILWAGGVAADAMTDAAEKFAGCGLHFVLGDADEYIRMDDANRQLEQLAKVSPHAKLWTFTGNHRMDAPTLDSIVKTFGA